MRKPRKASWYVSCINEYTSERKAHLLTNAQSVRLIQILERRGVSLDFFIGCVDEGLGWLDELDSSLPSSQAKFYEEIRKRHSNIIAMNAKNAEINDDILFHMASANLDPSEPYYATKRRDFVKKTAGSMRKKVRSLHAIVFISSPLNAANHDAALRQDIH